MARIEINHLSKVFGSLKALDSVELNLEKGQIVGLLGPNGSGKTTLIKLMNGLLTPSEGSISINGVSLTVVDSAKGSFSVAIIPYTYKVTNFHNFAPGTVVNIEFDVFGKYVQRLLEQYLGANAATKQE